MRRNVARALIFTVGIMGVGFLASPADAAKLPVVRKGTYCAKAMSGKQGITSKGVKVRCVKSGTRLRWS